jgi:cation diffusion facilitator family transporter
MQIRFKKIRNILIIVLLFNWIVAGAKIIYGIITQSTAMSADGFHSFADGASNIIGLVAIFIASQPKDSEHPYGHKKYETFAAIVIAILLFMISFNIIRGSIVRFFHPIIPEVTLISFIVMIAALAINCAVFIYEKAKAKVLTSDILAADAEHTKSDMLISISVIVTLIAVKAGFPAMDTIVSVCIALFIARNGLEILKQSSDVLCDRTVIPATEIKRVVLAVEGVKDCHGIRTRGRQDDIHIDLHIIVDADMTTGMAHNLNHEIQAAIQKKIEGVTDIAIHIEPDR